MDDATWKVVAGGSVGMFAVWTLGRIVLAMLNLVTTRDSNQGKRDDKRDELLGNFQKALTGQDATVKEFLASLKAAIDRNEERWAKLIERWERDDEDRQKKQGRSGR